MYTLNNPNSSNRVRHNLLRRIMNPSFSPTSLKLLEPTMNRYYDEFIKGIEQKAKQSGGIVEMTTWFHNLSFDVSR
jgi:cytochrome P450